MTYTVKKLAAMSGVSVRTLHWYDEMGLLKPAYHGANGYRYYEEAQLLTLQQILFYRELGFELKQIKRILTRGDFDKLKALESHRKVLISNLAHTKQLIVTIDKTIGHLKGTKKMKKTEMFKGFSPEQQAKHEEYLVERFGVDIKKSIDESKKKVKRWMKTDWEKAMGSFASICTDLVELMNRELPCESPEVQRVIRRHFEWLKQFWTPTRESYKGHSLMVEDSELRNAYTAYHQDLPKFMAAAMNVFAERELG
jgi:DNA-binding transcriptional MerR regulator